MDVYLIVPYVHIVRGAQSYYYEKFSKQDQIYTKSWQCSYSLEDPILHRVMAFFFTLCQVQSELFLFFGGGGSLFLFDVCWCETGTNQVIQPMTLLLLTLRELISVFVFNFFKFVIFVNSLRNHIVQLILNFYWSVLFDCCSISLHGCILLSTE